MTDQQLADKLQDAHSTSRYKDGWLDCVKALRQRGYTDFKIEWIIRSKLTRWAADVSYHTDGNVTAEDLLHYIDFIDPQALTNLWKELDHFELL
jgi:hypothetical protein